MNSVSHAADRARLAPWLPAVGLWLYAAVVHGVARFTPAYDSLLAHRVPTLLACIALVTTLAWSRSAGTWPATWRRWPIACALAFGLWVALVTTRAVAQGAIWPPPPRRHPIALVDALALLLVATCAVRRWVDVLAWGAVLLAASLFRALWFPDQLAGDGDLGLVVVLAWPLAAVALLGAPLVTVPAAIVRALPAVVIGLVATAVALGLVYQTQNRGAALGALAATLVLWASCRRRWSLAAVALVPLVAAGAWFRTTPYAERFAELARGEGSAYGSAQSRLELWRAGWDMFCDHPLWGVGAGNFAAQVGNYVSDSALAKYAAHSHVVTVATETGALGLALWLAVFLGGTGVAIRGWWQASDRPQAAACAGVAAALLAYLVTGCFITRHDSALAFALVGAALGLTPPAHRDHAA